MPDTARVLPFPSRPHRRFFSPAEAQRASGKYLETPVAERSSEFVEDCLSNSDTLLAICSTLKDLRNTSPARVIDESVTLYSWLTNAGEVGVFDEYEYFLGQVSFLIGSVFRLTGKW